MGYKDEIIDLINNISDEKVLRYLYNFIKNFLQKYIKIF